jgi:hypothetical protein
VILLLIIFVGIKIVPPYISNYQLQSSIQNIALIASYSPITEDEIRRNVISQANTCGVDLQPNQVMVKKGHGTVVIVVNYTVTVDFIARKMDIHFEPSTSNQNILMK